MEESMMMRHGCSSKWYTREEKEVAKILLGLQQQEHSEPPSLNWGRKRKRSAIQDVFLHHNKTQNNPSSPDTPLSFLPSTESHQNPKKRSPQKELYNVKLFYNKAKAYNLKLKAKEQLIYRQKSEDYKKPTLAMQSVHVNGSVRSSDSSKAQNATKQRQPQKEMMNLMIPFGNGPTQSERFIVSAHPTTSLQVPSSSSSNGLGHEAQAVLPDLNMSPKEFSQLNSSQPLNVASAIRDLKRFNAAEARRRRIMLMRQPQKTTL
ncbi:hypothetical protein JHK84_041182 [Glycine max]|nr:hypothetical protein JHK86_040971 [Glycine max]KAG5122842.1 hypothetical protein JHK84_041182 [Glycine max]